MAKQQGLFDGGWVEMGNVFVEKQKSKSGKMHFKKETWERRAKILKGRKAQ